MKKTIGILFIISGAILTISIRFYNIDMTETRLFITYWFEWLALFFLMLIGLKLYISGDNV